METRKMRVPRILTSQKHLDSISHEKEPSESHIQHKLKSKQGRPTLHSKRTSHNNPLQVTHTARAKRSGQ